MRITHGMISNEYKRNLNNSLSSLKYYDNRATTFRKFERASEDPFSAARAYKLRTEYQQNQDYQANLSDMESMLETGQSSMMSINKIAQEAGSSEILKAITGTMSQEDRMVVAKKLEKMQESIVATANTKFADQYLFGGSGITTPPFTMGDKGQLLYRGIDVDTGINTNGATANINGTQILFGKNNGDKLNDFSLKIVDGTASPSIDATNKTITVSLDFTAGSPTNKDLQDAFQSLGTQTINGNSVDFKEITVSGNPQNPVTQGTSNPITNQVDLNKLANEKMFVDLGLGLNFDVNGKINEQSVFDSAMTGISFLGFGTDSNGVPKNLYSQLTKIREGLSSDDFAVEKIQPYIDGFNQSHQNLLTKITEFGTKSNFADYAKVQLEQTEDSIMKKIDDVEFIDPVDAIMDFKMQEFSYRAALQMGTNILQPTFIDFMR